MNEPSNLKHSRLLALLKYDPDTGEFTWITDRSSVKAGQTAGSPRGKYLSISIDGRKYPAARLAYFYMLRMWPPEGLQIDHMDRNPRNNAWSNLRLCTSSQNKINRGLQRNNTTGIKGVHFNRARKLYEASYGLNGRVHYLGGYETLEAAAEARRAAERAHFGDFATQDPQISCNDLVMTKG